jgi:hypothetical protein
VQVTIVGAAHQAEIIPTTHVHALMARIKLQCIANHAIRSVQHALISTYAPVVPYQENSKTAHAYATMATMQTV